MTEWKKAHYSTPKSWGEIQREKAKEDFERKYPSKWWHDTVFTLAGWSVILAFIASVIATLVGLWGILR